MSAVAAAGIAGAQVQVRLTGQIENTGGLERLRTGDSLAQALGWGSSYSPVLDGWVVSPRLLHFSAAGTYSDQTTEMPGGKGESVQLDPYRIRLDVLPGATHSFDLEASRSMSENTFSSGATRLFGTHTTEIQGLGWNYRGSALLPETSLVLKRQTLESTGPAFVLDENRMSAALRLRKSFERATPALSYVLETVEQDGFGAGQPGTASRDVSHMLQYEDRVRVGDRWFLTPTLSYQRSEQTQRGAGALGLAGPLSPTLDGSGALRYSVDDRSGSTMQTVSADGSLTKRLTPNVTVTGGASAGLVDSGGLSWAGGLFSGLSATPLPHLRTAADYGLQLTAGERPLTASHRGHLGAASTFFPRHTLTGDYFVSLFDRGGAAEPFVSHTGTLGVTSLAIPRTTLTGTMGLERQEGDGSQDGQNAGLSATVALTPAVALRGAVDVGHSATSGGGRAPSESLRYGADGGIDVSPLDWLTLSLSGRRAVREVRQEDKTGEFVSEAIRGQATGHVAGLLFQVEGFLEREPVVDQSRLGVRGNLSYRFRVWTATLEFERSVLDLGGVDLERTNIFLRISRPLNYSFGWP